ncbi:hypothetical protein MBLNU13_g09621t1 [Cladosporium sp. NU13]
MASAREAALPPFPQSFSARRRGIVDDHDPPAYIRLYTHLRALIVAQKSFICTVFVWAVVDLFVETSDIAQTAKAMQQAPGTQDSAQIGISAWGLFSHSSKIIALFVYLYIAARRQPPVFPAMNQYFDGSNLSQLFGSDLSVFVQSGEIELGNSEMGFVRTDHLPTRHLHSKSHLTSASYTTSPQPLKQAYVQVTRASSSNGALRAVDSSLASSALPEQYEMQTFHGHVQLPEQLTRPPPVLTRQHSLAVRSEVLDHDSTLRALLGEKCGQARQVNAVDHATASSESPVHSPREFNAIHKHISNQPVPTLPLREQFPTRPSSASSNAEGPPGPVMIRQV